MNTAVTDISRHCYRADIDGLRALAVLAVILFHLYPHALPGGYVGVDVFFVISGFLITGLILPGLDSQQFSFCSFYARRIRRLFPALLLVLFGTVALGWFVLTPMEYTLLGSHVLTSGLFVENISLWQEVSYFDINAELKPLLHLWSLAVEEQFYLFFPALLLLLHRMRIRLATTLLVCSALSIALSIYWLAAHPERSFYLLPARFWELGAGAWLACMLHNRPTHFTWPSLRLLSMQACGCGLLLLAIFDVVGTGTYGLAFEWLAAVVATVLLLLSLPSTSALQRTLCLPWMQYLGKISYPLYLWHWPLLSLLRLSNRDHLVSTPGKIAVLVITLLLSMITYHFVERPLRSQPPTLRRTLLLLAAMLLVCCAGIGIALNQGIPARYPPQVQAIIRYHLDERKYAGYGHCWVAREPPDNIFATDCLGSLSPKPRVLLWGDSHAAHLYPGIDARYGNQRQVAEFTRSTCPPILGQTDNKIDCIAGNQQVMATISQYKPDTVILFALWGGYAERWTRDQPLAEKLHATIAALHAAGIKRVILIGPAPQWQVFLPGLVLDDTLDDIPRYQIPSRLNHSLLPRGAIIDDDMRKLVADLPGVAYFSAIDALCNAEGCLARTTDSPTSFTSYDYGHFTLDGARYIAERLPLP